MNLNTKLHYRISKVELENKSLRKRIDTDRLILSAFHKTILGICDEYQINKENINKKVIENLKSEIYKKEMKKY